MSLVLKIDWCSYEAAKYACETWHYSKSIPAGKRAMLGVWENGKFIGAVIYGNGANNHIGNPYGLNNFQIIELTRIALTTHHSPVSQIVAFTIKKIEKEFPKIQMIVSYADSSQGHTGAIYQSMNWFYVGKTKGDFKCIINRKIVHRKTVNSLYGSIKGIAKIKDGAKYKYLYPLNGEMKKKILPLSLPYPKRLLSIENDAPVIHTGMSAV
jgi:hypothetical protein